MPEIGNKAEHAHQLLRKMLVQLEIEPGALLDERRLPAVLGVGRTPVREALQRLASEGLVEVIPRRGTFAAPISVSNVRQVFECRIGFEGYATRLATQKATDADLDELSALLPLAEAAVATGDAIAIAQTDIQVHRRLWAIAHNAHLQAILEQYYALGHRIWHYTYRHGLHARAHHDMASEWATITAALRERNPAQAQRCMEEHIAHISRVVTDSNWFRHMTPSDDSTGVHVLS